MGVVAFLCDLLRATFRKCNQQNGKTNRNNVINGLVAKYLLMV